MRIGTKFGFLNSGQSKEYDQLIKSSNLSDRMFKVTDEVYHCIDERVMKHQLEKAITTFRSVLGPQYAIDLFFIHNPELSLLRQSSPTQNEGTSSKSNKAESNTKNNLSQSALTEPIQVTRALGAEANSERIRERSGYVQPGEPAKGQQT